MNFFGADYFKAEIGLDSEGKQGFSITTKTGERMWITERILLENYIKVGDDNAVTESMISDFIKKIDVFTFDNKTTVVRATLKNGFVIVESSSCVDEKNFDMELGKKICLKKIHNKVGELLGFLLQTAIHGIIN